MKTIELYSDKIKHNKMEQKDERTTIEIINDIIKLEKEINKLDKQADDMMFLYPYLIIILALISFLMMILLPILNITQYHYT